MARDSRKKRPQTKRLHQENEPPRRMREEDQLGLPLEADELDDFEREHVLPQLDDDSY